MGGNVPAKQTETEREIIAQAKSVLGSAPAKARLPAKPADGFLVVNNSFLHRAQAQFRKGAFYLGIAVDRAGATDLENPHLITGVTKIADFDFIPTSDSRIEASPLSEAVPGLLRDFGGLIFMLLGEVHPGGRFEEHIAQSRVLTTLVLDPAVPDEIMVKPPQIVLNRLLDADRVWSHIQSVGGWEVETNFGSHLAAAIGRLRAKAHDDLSIPRSPTEIGSLTLLDQMTEAFGAATMDYEQAVVRWQAGDQAGLTDVMRLAYNFSSDAMQLADFVTALSDLKPLIQLLTIEHQLAFATAIRSLLRRRADQKPSLAAYRETISDARSSAFHRLIPFAKAIQVQGLELRGATVRLFPEYESRKGNVVDYQDRPLLELLTQMARPTVRELEDSFWVENVAVMRSTVELLRRLRGALVAVLADTSGPDAQ
jgi:hypothetical protein